MRRHAWGALPCLLALLGTILLAGCSVELPIDDGRPDVVCTTFASYDWARNIMGEREALDLTLLLDDGVDLHSFQPSVADIARVSDADLFVYVGGESDEWVADALSMAENEDVRCVSLLDVVGEAALAEETVEGMQLPRGHEHEHAREHEHEHGDADHDGHEDHDADGEDHEEESDEHVWLSLRRAELVVDVLAEELCALDPEGTATYEANAQAYREELAALDAEYAAMVASSPRDTVLFGDRFPFRYLLDDYGISYYAAFLGCSAETEASFETIVFLAQKTAELRLSQILVCEDSDRLLARTIADASGIAGIEIASIDSLQSTSMRDIEAGRTYLIAMRENLDALRRALV